MKRVLTVLLLLAAIGYLVSVLGPAESRTTYISAAVERGDIITSTTSTGTIEAVVTVQVGSQLSGQVEELFVDFNAEVAKDQAIARLDQQSFSAEVREARAALAIAETGVQMQQAAVHRARSNVAKAEARRPVLEARAASAALALVKSERELARAESLRGKGAIANSTLEDAKTARDTQAVELRSAKAEQAVHEEEITVARADFEVATAQLANVQGVVAQKQAVLEQASIRLERTTIRSPIDGVVIGRNIDRGQTVAASLEAPTLFRIAQDLRRMEVHAKIDEADIGRIQLGQRAVFAVDSYPRRTFSGQVTQIRKAPETVKNVVVYTVLISTENPDLALLPGMTAVVEIIVDEVIDVLKIPNAALRFRPPEAAFGAAQGARAADAVAGDSATTVWVLAEDGALSPVRIGIGASDATATQLTSGQLAEGQSVVVGYSTVSEGWSLMGLHL